MATDTVTIEQFINANRISLTSEYADRNPHMDDSDSMDNYKCVLLRPTGTRERRDGDIRGRKLRMTVYFSKGMGHHGAEPKAADVLSCLASDAAGVENAGDFTGWCSEYGYDEDSRKEERTWKVCEHQARRLKRFLGDELYDRLLWHTEWA